MEHNLTNITYIHRLLRYVVTSYSNTILTTILRWYIHTDF